MSFVKSFESFFGNALQGIYITWGCEQVNSSSYAVAADTELTMDIELRMYGVGYLGLDSTATLQPANVAFYILWQNPVDIYSYNPTSFSPVYDAWVPYDGVLGTLTAAYTTVADGADTVTLASSAADAVVDIICGNNIEAGKYDSTNCADDTAFAGKTNGKKDDVSILDAPASGDHCEEKWVIEGNTIRCVKAAIKLKRKFQTTDNTPDESTPTED